MRLKNKLLAVVCSLVLVPSVFAASEAQTPAENAVPRVQNPQTMTLRPGDMLRIGVWPNQELGGEFQIEDTGNIHLPLIGEIQAAGVPLGELRQRLRRGYGEAMQNPVVTITPVFSVGVMGAVRSPGVYQVTPSQGLFDVIGRAGGFAGNAQQENVRIVREGEVVAVNALRALEEGRGLMSAGIRPGDQIVVPGGSDFTFRDVLSIIQTTLTMGLLVDRIVR